MADKVAILGTVPNSRIMAPYDDKSWDIWCCSAGNSQIAAPPRIDEWFEIHSIVDLNAPENKNWYPQYIEWLRKQQFPIWMQEPNDDIPRCRIFPRKVLMDRFGPNKTMANWFTSSPAWMFAFAIERGYKTIGVFGVDMAAAEEHYTGQKAGLQYFFQKGRELGIKVVVPLESTLSFNYPLYGYAESSRQGRALLVRENELKNAVNVLNQQRAELERRVCNYQGALDQVIFDRRTYVSGVSDAEIDGDQFVDVAQTDCLTFGRERMYIEPRALSGSPQFSVVPTEPVVGAARPTADDFPDNPDAMLLRKKMNGSEPPKPENEINSPLDADNLSENGHHPRDIG